MSHVIRLAGGVPQMIRQAPELLDHVGEYVVHYDPDLAPKGEQWLWTSPDVEEAKLFPDAAAALEYCRQDVGVRPWDGQPNRPLTVFHIQIARK